MARGIQRAVGRSSAFEIFTDSARAFELAGACTFRGLAPRPVCQSSYARWKGDPSLRRREL